MEPVNEGDEFGTEFEYPEESKWTRLKRWGRVQLIKLGNKLADSWPVNRVVIALTPILFAPAAAWATGWITTHFPGIPPLSEEQVTYFMGAAFAAALGGAYAWLRQHQRERNIALTGDAKGRPVIEAPVNIEATVTPPTPPDSSDIHPDDSKVEFEGKEPIPGFDSPSGNPV